MNKLNSIALAFFSLMVIYSCDQSKANDTDNSQDTASESTEIEQEDVEEVIAEVAQTVDERILEIKKLYAEIQASPKNEKNCTSGTKTSYDGMEGGYPFENTAKECNLENDLMYQQVELNGHEWTEKTSFYFKDGKRFFTFLSGGAEACGYDYRVYYDKEGEVIRVLAAENDCDGNEVPSSTEVTDSKKKKEILKSVANAEKELNGILKK